MKRVRSDGQKLIPFTVSPGFLSSVDEGMRKLGFVNRSQFVRDAIVDKLAHSGIKLHPGLAQAPCRIGKGGPRPRRSTRAKR